MAVSGGGVRDATLPSTGWPGNNGRNVEADSNETGTGGADKTSLEARFLEACDEGRLEEVKELVLAGANVLARDADGANGLALACIGGSLPVVRWLCDRPESTKLLVMGDDEGCTPFYWAALTGRIAVLDELFYRPDAELFIGKCDDMQRFPWTVAEGAALEWLDRAYDGATRAKRETKLLQLVRARLQATNSQAPPDFVAPPARGTQRLLARIPIPVLDTVVALLRGR